MRWAPHQALVNLLLLMVVSPLFFSFSKRREEGVDSQDSMRGYRAEAVCKPL